MALADEINPKTFYESIVHFDDSDESKDYYYKAMDTLTGRTNKDGSGETVRDRFQ